MHFRWNDGIWGQYRHVDYRPQRITRDEHKIIASEGTRNKHMTSALEGTFGRLPYDNWVFDRLPYTDLATKTIPPQRLITTRSGTMKRKKAEEDEGKSTNKDFHERMQRARDA